jgi:glycosyltransferase involved in cell wall biosynthesis
VAVKAKPRPVKVVKEGGMRESQPSVCCVMLTKDRPELARRAVECFRAQTYDPIARALLIFDSGSNAWFDAAGDSENEIVLDATAHAGKATIGELRNMANSCMSSDIILHWDSDDWSHPNRIAEQVALLRSSGADCVGYREMLFWRESLKIESDSGDGRGPHLTSTTLTGGEAWLYSSRNHILGTSLCYWHKTWERKPFEATSSGEDVLFCARLNCVGASSVIRGALPSENGPTIGEYLPLPLNAGPRMIARIHAGNTSKFYDPALMAAVERQGGEWRRVPEWDAYCAEKMAL